MPALYSSQYALGDSAIGPSGENYEPIQNLDPLNVTDDFLYFGGTASISLFLGTAFTDVDSFSLYVRVIEAVAVNVSALCRPTRSAKARRIKRRAAHYAIASRLVLHHEEM